MITAVALMCLLEDGAKCQVMPSSVYYPTIEVCERDRIGAELHALSNSMFVAGYKCINWGEPA